MASQEGLQPEILYYFASDQDQSVREAVAKNTTTPLQADVILSEDNSEEVRQDLARKIGRLLPDLDLGRANKVAEMVMEIVAVLANDKAAKVRQIVAEQVKSLSNMPPVLIEKLAWDAESIVSAPVLEYSPLLSETQLLQIIRSGIDGGALTAVAKRKNVSEAVSDAIVEEKHDGSTSTLLANFGTQISEQTFLKISNRAKESDQIKTELIEREDLTLSTVRRIASFVGNSVIDRILERNKKHLDIDEEVVREIRQKVTDQIMKGGVDEREMPGEESRAHAEKLFGKDKLTEKVIIKAIDKTQRMFIIHSLALLAELKWEKVRDILSSRSGKSIVALCWKSGLSAETSMSIQTKLGALHGSNLVRPKKDGGYTMTDDDLDWYLDFYR